MTKLKSPSPQPLSRSGRGAFNLRILPEVPSCGRRNLGMMGQRFVSQSGI
ncbi:hypothetical protein [Hydrococcus rivularis]|nr:hypothetical protein [Hydrococcus rivularis]